MAESYGTFTWEDPFLFEEQLTDEERAVMQSARDYAQAKLMPRVLMANRNEVFHREIMNEMGDAGLLGPTCVFERCFYHVCVRGARAPD